MNYSPIYVRSEQDFTKIYEQLVNHGTTSAPRGQATVEIENVSYELSPYVRFCNFPSRKLSLDYIKREWQWYLAADPTDTRIAKYAKIWGPLVKDGIINSNYGAYWFRSQYGVREVVEELRQDPDSRRAVIPMLGVSQRHYDKDIVDKPCTTSIEFRIRRGRLNTRAVMRSQDAIFGLGNDVPAFSFLSETVAKLLSVQLGTLTVSVGSLHYYGRHSDMVKQIQLEKSAPVDVPRMSTLDAVTAISYGGVHRSTDFGKWLTSVEL